MLRRSWFNWRWNRGFTAIDTANQLIHYQEALVGEALQSLAQRV